MENVFELIAPFLDLHVLVAIGNRSVIIRETVRRVCMTDDERGLVLKSRSTQDLPRGVRVRVLTPAPHLLHAISSSKLMDPRTKARVYTFLEIGDVRLRNIFDWFVDSLVYGPIVARPIALNNASRLDGGPIHHFGERYAAVVDKAGSIRLYDKQQGNRVIGAFDRCSLCILAFPDTIDTAEALVQSFSP